MITVREAEITDSYDIALINIKDWENSLKGLVPDLFLANISVERRTGIWADILESAVSDTERVIFVSVHRGEINGYIHGLVTGESPVNLKIIDFAVSGNATQDTRRALFRQMMDFCARKKVHNMYALCTAQSDSADFYRMFSGKVSDVKEIDISGEKVPHTLFVWKSISDIVPVRKNIAKQILEITGIIGPVVCIILALLLGAALSHRELISMDFMYSLYPVLFGAFMLDRLLVRIEDRLVSSVITIRLRKIAFFFLFAGAFTLPVLFFAAVYHIIIPATFLMFSFALYLQLRILSRYILLLTLIRKRGSDVQKNS